MVEMLPVLAVPIGDDGEAGPLASHGFAESVAVGDVAYGFEMAPLKSLEDFTAECDDDAGLEAEWETAEEARLEAERKYNETEARKEENPGACEEAGRGGRPKDSRVRMLGEAFRDSNVTLEVVTRGFSCWLNEARNEEDKPESTYGAIMLYGTDGGEVLLVNTTGMHTVPIMRNVRANALLQKIKKDDSIKVGFSIFERTPREFGGLVETVLTILANLLLGFAFAFPPPFYVAFIVEEKALGIKGQMLVSGVRGV